MQSGYSSVLISLAFGSSRNLKRPPLTQGKKKGPAGAGPFINSSDGVESVAARPKAIIGGQGVRLFKGRAVVEGARILLDRVQGTLDFIVDRGSRFFVSFGRCQSAQLLKLIPVQRDDLVADGSLRLGRLNIIGKVLDDRFELGLVCCADGVTLDDVGRFGRCRLIG